MKPRILVFTSTFPRWKDDTDPPFVFELCRRLTQNFEVFVLTPAYPGAARREELEGVKIHRFRYFWAPCEKLAGATGILPTIRRNRFYLLLVPFFLGFSFFSLLVLTRRIKPSLIHAHWLIPQGIIASLVGRICETNYIVTAHGSDVFGLKGKVFDKLRNHVVANACAVTVVSSAVKKRLVESGSRNLRMHTIPMGVDSSIFQSDNGFWESEQAKTQVARLLYVGRLTEVKGIDYLIKAIPEVNKYYPEIKLTIAGSGELESELKEMTAQLNLEGLVDFIGGVPNRMLPEIYRDHAIFIAPSIEASGGIEGFGLTLVEAGMAGCLVIATGAGGTADIIQNMVTGLQVEQKNAHDIAEKIQFALENPELIRNITKEMRERCRKEYDWRVIANRYAEVFRESLQTVNS